MQSGAIRESNNRQQKDTGTKVCYMGEVRSPKRPSGR